MSFTHLIGYAVVRALAAAPEMNYSYAEVDGKPALVQPEHVNLGLAIDVPQGDGSRQLLVPSIKAAEAMDFRQFWMAYEDVVRRARTGKLTVDDFAGTTISLTNPGTIGTEHSVPRLMPGQGTHHRRRRDGVPGRLPGRVRGDPGPAGDQQDRHADLDLRPPDHPGRAVRRVPAADPPSCCSARTASTTRSSSALRIPYEPVRWVQDIPAGHEDDIDKAARVHELIHAYRVRGHLMADTDPLEYKQRKHPDLDINQHGLTLWDLEREFATGGFGGKPLMKLREILGVLRDSYCRTVGVEYMHIQNPRGAGLDPGAGRAAARPGRRTTSRCRSCPGSTWPRRSRRSCRPSSSASGGSRWRAPSR